MTDDLNDLRARLVRANESLLAGVDNYFEAIERVRLRGKAEGVRLALSYLDETVALLAPAPASETARCANHGKSCVGVSPDCPAPTPPTTVPRCDTCNDTGRVLWQIEMGGGWGDVEDDGTVPCADCTPPMTVQADRGAPIGLTGHRWPCQQFYVSADDTYPCTCTPATPGEAVADLDAPARDAGQMRLSDELAEIREALRHEIGPPTDRDRKWQPMVSAHEVRMLLDEIDRLTARQSDPDATEQVVADLVRLIDYWETQAGVDRDMESKTLRGVVAHLRALVRRTVTTGEWTEVGDRG